MPRQVSLYVVLGPFLIFEQLIIILYLLLAWGPVLPLPVGAKSFVRVSHQANVVFTLEVHETSRRGGVQLEEARYRLVQ